MASLSYLSPPPAVLGTIVDPLSAVPKELRPLRIVASRELEFPLLTLADDGQFVEKGQLLWAIDTTSMDRKLRALKLKITRQHRRLRQEKATWQRWLATTFSDLEALQDLAVSKQEQAEHFRRIVSTTRRDVARNAIRRANQMLSHQVEEYRALFSIEKIRSTGTHLASRLLERQQGSMAAAEFCVGMEALNHRKIIDRQLPRELSYLADAAENVRRQYAAALVVCTRRMELRAYRRAQAEARFASYCDQLAALETDRSLCILRAPSAGRFFHASSLVPDVKNLASGQVVAFFQPA